MSFGFGMGAGLRALTAAQLGMQTAGNNVANANTPGYSRQRVDLGSALPYGLVGNLQIGTGVNVNGISRLVDDGLERRIQLQLGMVGSATLDELRYREVENIFGEPDDGLSNQFKDLFGALDQLRTDPADRALRGGLAQAGNTLSQNFRLLSQRLGELGGGTFNETRGLVRQVNERTAAIAALNGQILSIESNGSIANDLRDTRAQQIRELGDLIDVRAIERSSGSVDLLIGGNLAVAGNRSTDLRVGKDDSDMTKVMIGGSEAALNLSEGRIAALLRQEASNLPQFTSRIDQLARQTILEWNRLHTTGMPGTGPFDSLIASYGAVDGDGDGNVGDELLSQAGFPFEITDGELYVAVTNEATGEMQRSRIDVVPSQMTLESFAAELSAIDNLSATVDPTGRLRVSASAGYGFDFSPRLDPNPDSTGTFGGTSPVDATTIAFVCGSACTRIGLLRSIPMSCSSIFSPRNVRRRTCSVSTPATSVRASSACGRSIRSIVRATVSASAISSRTTAISCSGSIGSASIARTRSTTVGPSTGAASTATARRVRSGVTVIGSLTIPGRSPVAGRIAPRDSSTRRISSGLATETTHGRKLLEAIIGLLKQMNLRCCVEGVEDPAIERLVVSLGCEELQGYLIGRPELVDPALTQLEPSTERARFG